MVATMSTQSNVSRALEYVRNSDTGDIHPSVSAILERALADIWQRIQASPNSYIMTKEEFAVFNYYRERFVNSDVARRAVGRFWNTFKGDASDINGFHSR